jgi:hypothetical protein
MIAVALSVATAVVGVSLALRIVIGDVRVHRQLTRLTDPHMPMRRSIDEYRRDARRTTNARVPTFPRPIGAPPIESRATQIAREADEIADGVRRRLAARHSPLTLQ